MAVWRHILDVKDIWEDENLPFEDLRDGIVKRIREADFFNDDLTDVVDDLEYSETESEFDSAWNDFYDWCDDHRVWVKALF